MTRDEARDRILERLGKRSVDEYGQAIFYEMDDVQKYELEQDVTLLPWFMITESSSAEFTVNEERLEIPTDFLLEHEDSRLQVYNSTSQKWVPMLKDDWDTIVAKYDDSDPGQPAMYALVNQYFRVRPVPDFAYPVKFLYYAAQELPAQSNVENVWLQYAADLLLARVGERMASRHLQDMELATKFAAEALVARDRLWRQNEARMHAGRDYQMGDD